MWPTSENYQLEVCPQFCFLCCLHLYTFTHKHSSFVVDPYQEDSVKLYFGGCSDQQTLTGT